MKTQVGVGGLEDIVVVGEGVGGCCSDGFLRLRLGLGLGLREESEKRVED